MEYPALTCMNDEGLRNRIRVEGAEERIFAVNASQKLNSDIAYDFRRQLAEHKIEFLVPWQTAMEEILPGIPEYTGAVEADDAMIYEGPFLETQALISEATELSYEKKSDTGIIVLREAPGARKDRYSSCSYASYFASLLERDLLTGSDDYQYETFIN